MKWEAGGPVKRARLCGSWPKRGPVLNPPSCASELNLLSGSGGQHSWHVLLDVLCQLFVGSSRMWQRGR